MVFSPFKGAHKAYWESRPLFDSAPNCLVPLLDDKDQPVKDRYIMRLSEINPWKPIPCDRSDPPLHFTIRPESAQHIDTLRTRLKEASRQVEVIFAADGLDLGICQLQCQPGRGPLSAFTKLNRLCGNGLMGTNRLTEGETTRVIASIADLCGPKSPQSSSFAARVTASGNASIEL